MSIRVAHVSDIHIRKLRYHKEYKVVFEELYEKLREESNRYQLEGVPVKWQQMSL